jgi:hypothetical protein
MIDKLDTRVPGRTPYTYEFSKVYVDLRRDPKGPFRAAQHYSAVADLRPYGYEAILHTHCKHGKGDHKIELIDTGIRNMDFMTHELRRIFSILNTNDLGIMRVDFATDVPGVPVSWFLSQARVKFKRFHNAITGGLEYQQLGQKGVQTIYFGKRPNCYRIYDKVAEYLHQYQRLKRHTPEGANLPTFESCYGVTANSVLTRVERQIGGGRLPEQIRTIGKLRRHAADFNPFSNLTLSQATRGPQPSDFRDRMQYMGVMYARELIQQMGQQAFYQWLNVNRNAKRWWDRHGFWLGDSAGVTSPELYARFHDSVSKQLTA